MSFPSNATRMRCQQNRLNFPPHTGGAWPASGMVLLERDVLVSCSSFSTVELCKGDETVSAWATLGVRSESAGDPVLALGAALRVLIVPVEMDSQFT